MRRRPGARAAASTKPPPPAAASRNSAASATRRASGPHTPRPCQTSRLGPSEMRSRWGLIPNRPQNAAGMRIEPPPSEPRATPTMPVATAAPVPPLEPPGVWSSDHGLRVAPKASDSVNGKIVSSGTCVLPMTIAPASRSARTTSASRSRGPAVRQRAPRRDLAGDVGVVLDRHRHAEQRAPIAGAAARIGLVGLHQGAVGEHHAEGVELGVRLPDALERRLDELARRDLAGGHQARLLGGAGEAEVGGVHGAAED